MAKKKALGKGLGALISDAEYERKSASEVVSTGSVAEIDIDQIEVNPFQARTKFDEEALNELASSIKELGIIQPITVRKIKDDKFQLISGERRYRASKIAGLKSIISFVRDADDKEMLEMSLVENIQRQDLNSIEIAISYQRLIDECNLTQEEMSERVGKKRSTISNYLRLLKLPAEIQIGIRDERISMGHARALINIEKPKKQLKIFYRILNDGLSVRNAEKLVREINFPVRAEKKEVKSKILEKHLQFKNDLARQLQAKIDLKCNENGRGRIIIPFTSDEEFDRIRGILSKLH